MNNTRKKELPKYYETYIPILTVLSDEKKYHHKEMKDLVVKKFYSNLDDELLNLVTEKTKTNILLDRIGWAKSYLKMANMIRYPERGYVQITKKGLEILEKGTLSKEELFSDSDYKNYKKNKKLNAAIGEATKVTDISPNEMMEIGFSTIEDNLKSELLGRLRESNPYFFEKIILRLFQKMGYGDFQETKKSGDGGIDGIINQDALGIEKIYTQAKRYTTNNVGEKDIRNFKGAMDDGEVSKGIFVTTSSFDNKAMKSANNSRNKIILIDGEKLVELMIKYNLGVQTKNAYYIKEIDEDFFIED